MTNCPQCDGPKVAKAKLCRTCSNASRGLNQRHSDGIEDYKSCKHCSQTLPISAFNKHIKRLNGRCRDCQHKYEHERYWKHNGARKKKMHADLYAPRRINNRLIKVYGITLDQYNEMLEKQGGGCAICGGMTQNKRCTQMLHVDHDHATGKVRGLLCNKCNPALGLFREDKQLLVKAISYLEVPYDLVA